MAPRDREQKMVPRVRFELTRPKGHCPLKTACLPFHHLGLQPSYGVPAHWGKPPRDRPDHPHEGFGWQGRQDLTPPPVDLEACQARSTPDCPSEATAATARSVFPKQSRLADTRFASATKPLYTGSWPRRTLFMRERFVLIIRKERPDIVHLAQLGKYETRV